MAEEFLGACGIIAIPDGEIGTRKVEAMDCHRVRATMFLLGDDEIERELLAPFREHIGSCSECAEYRDYSKKLLSLVRDRCLRYTAPSDLRIRILESLQAQEVRPASRVTE